MIPPKPPSRPDRLRFWQHLRAFRRDILSAQPERLYRAWMAEFRTPFFRSYLCNDPALIDRVLGDAADDFPKSDRVREGLAPLLGRSVFVTNGEEWRRQRRIIDPAFGAGNVLAMQPAMVAAGKAAVRRLSAQAGQVVDVEPLANHAAADVIFRALFSVPIEDRDAAAIHQEFRAYQRAQPLLNLAAFLRLPRWLPRLHRPATRRSAARIRALIGDMVDARVAQVRAGTAPDDLATRLMTLPDPVTGRPFTAGEIVDQVAIFLLAGHETSASALAWTLYLVACDPGLQDALAAEATEAFGGATEGALQEAADPPRPAALAGRLPLARDVFRETLRLYPPVPMMVREATCPVVFRGRDVRPGSQIVLSPWHLHRHERLWDRPDAFDPGRWRTPAGRQSARAAWLPFSKGTRVCPGAGFAMAEGPILLAILLREFRLFPEDPPPMPVAHLTVRAFAGIHLKVTRRHGPDS